MLSEPCASGMQQGESPGASGTSAGASSFCNSFWAVRLAALRDGARPRPGQTTGPLTTPCQKIRVPQARGCSPVPSPLCVQGSPGAAWPSLHCPVGIGTWVARKSICNRYLQEK